MVSKEWVNECAECETCKHCGNNRPKLYLVCHCDLCNAEADILYRVDDKEVCKGCAIDNAIRYDKYDEDFRELIWKYWLDGIERVEE